ncbi:iron chaperone [Marinoscillum pacificum]|uniref:iron chaperone n=1 Tax=Marinoscillum pacificum TaxID=392723 RepID=UPI0021578202|nr:DUF1801 domain-containing protein [Marinoscillum pacificum]
MNEVDAYIESFDEQVQIRLREMRTILKEMLPQAEEVISYGIPTYKIKGKNVVHFGGFKKHVGFYPAPSGLEAFKEDLSKFKGSKGSVQFPLTEDLPKALIQRITQFRLVEHMKKYGS